MKHVTKRTGLPLALVALGIIMAVVGSVFSTVARPSPEVKASLESPDVPYVMTHEGVLDLFESDATITATAANDSPVVIAVGRSTDISAWLDGAAYAEIVGLSSWTELKTNEESATSDDTEPGSPATSDMWVRTETGTGSVSLTQPHGTSDMSVIIATDGENPAPSVTITWQRSVSIAWAITLTAVGVILTLLGLTLAWQFHRSSKNRDPERRKRELVAQQRPDAPMKETIEATAGGKTVKFPSRRAIREARERGEAEIVIEGRKFDTGLIPVVEKVRDVEEAELPGEVGDALADELQSDEVVSNEPQSGDVLPEEAQTDDAQLSNASKNPPMPLEPDRDPTKNGDTDDEEKPPLSSDSSDEHTTESDDEQDASDSVESDDTEEDDTK